jgi:ubiquinone/menaquinone biosynthesis C-methylase UbiE
MADFTKIAAFYDRMTGFGQRLENDYDAIKELVKRFHVQKALDAGCGTGVHAIILAKLGVDVTGFDISPEMLDKAQENAECENVEPELIRAEFEYLPEEWTGVYDTVFCLANSLAGAETKRRLIQALKAFRRTLKPGGRAIIQLLNIPFFRESGRRVIRVSTDGPYIFVRFLDFIDFLTRLNVLILERDGENFTSYIVSEPILAISPGLLTNSATEAGFKGVQLFADLSLDTAFHSESDNIVAILSA